MKKTLMTMVVVLTGMWAQATLYPLYSINQTFNSSAPVYNPNTDLSMPGTGTIGDGQIGQAFYGAVTAQPWERVVAAAVTLNISGGYNGDLYGYLIAPNGTVSMLLNESAGLTGSGMNNVTLTSFNMSSPTAFAVGGSYPGEQSLTPFSGTSIQAATDGGVLTGTFGSAGSMLYGPSYGPANSLTLAQYLSLPAAAGVWTLFLQDNNPDDPYGNGDHTLTSWSLTLAVVPEPVDLSLGIFAAIMICFAGVKRYWTPKPEA